MTCWTSHTATLIIYLGEVSQFRKATSTNYCNIEILSMKFCVHIGSDSLKFSCFSWTINEQPMWSLNELISVKVSGFVEAVMEVNLENLLSTQSILGEKHVYKPILNTTFQRRTTRQAMWCPKNVIAKSDQPIFPTYT